MLPRMRLAYRTITIVGVCLRAALLSTACAGSPAPDVHAPEAPPPAPTVTTAVPSALVVALGAPRVAAPPPPPATPVVLTIIVEQQTGYDTPTRAKKLKDAVDIAQKVLNDPEYRAAMIAYPDHHGLAGFTQATMYGGGSVTSNAEPMEALLRGNGPDGQIHVWLDVARLWLRDTVGHTAQSRDHNGVTTTKGSVLDKMTVAQLADHIVHEQMHRVDYQHADDRSFERCDSVPYVYGRTVCAFATHKYGLPGRCDDPDDWPPEQVVPRVPAHGPRC
jgi:hypothetical protein